MKYQLIIISAAIFGFSLSSYADYSVKQINSSTATVVVESDKIPLQVPKDLAITLSDGDQCIGHVLSIQDRIILLDVNKCPNRGKIRLGQLATESIDIAPSEMLRQQIQPVQAEQPAAKPAKKEFTVEDGQPHYAFKGYYSMAPIAAFNSMAIGSNTGVANLGLTSGFGFRMEYGFYVSNYWNLVAGAGYDFERSMVSEQYAMASSSFPTGPVMKLSALSLYLSVNYPFSSVYINGSFMITMPSITFNNASAGTGQGGVGIEGEAGFLISKRWAAFGSYRYFQVSANAEKNSVKYSYGNGALTDILLGARYIYR